MSEQSDGNTVIVTKDIHIVEKYNGDIRISVFKKIQLNPDSPKPNYVQEHTIEIEKADLHQMLKWVSKKMALIITG